MARRTTTVTIDEALLDAARTVAEQSGTTADEVIEAALRRHLALVRPSVVDEVWARQGARPLSAEEAMKLAYTELDAFRAEPRASSR
ncbi:MAG: hypothetical protein ACRD0D_07290 [Acidimicrobiales bacterium]